MILSSYYRVVSIEKRSKAKALKHVEVGDRLTFNIDLSEKGERTACTEINDVPINEPIYMRVLNCLIEGYTLEQTHFTKQVDNL